MARKRAYAPLDVLLNGRLVGKLSREASGAIEFRYDENWLAWAHAIPASLSLPLREERYVGAPVVAVFDNLLPDNENIRRQIAGRVRAPGSDAFSLLSAIGRDCVGALQFIAEGETIGPTGAVDGEVLSDTQIAAIVKNLAQSPLGLGEDAEFRISIAGAQEKTALLRKDGAWLRPHGVTATTHILKPQIGLTAGLDLRQSVENEYFCLEILRALGLPAAESEIVDFEDVRVLSITRFDRQWAEDGRLLRVPQEDFCQALSVPSALKYEADGGPGIPAILRELQASDDPQTDQVLFLKAQFAYWLLGATDGHAKNFSVFLAPGGRFQLTPFYDVMSAQPNVDARQIPWNKYKLAMAAGHQRRYQVNRIGARHLIETAEAAGIDNQRAAKAWEEIAAALPRALDAAREKLPPDFPEPLADSIRAGALKRLHAQDTPGD